MTQSFFVVEDQTGDPGHYVALNTLLIDVNQVISGKYDHFPEEKFLYVGSLEDINKK